MPFDLTDLRLFLNILEAASITRGADASHLALASARTHRALETRLGTRLFDRERRGVRPTPAGIAFVGLMCSSRGEMADYAQGLKAMCACGPIRRRSEFLPTAMAGRPPADRPGRAAQPPDRAPSPTARPMLSWPTSSIRALETWPIATDQLVLVTPADHRSKARGIGFHEVLDQEFVGLGTGINIIWLIRRPVGRPTSAFGSAARQYAGWSRRRCGILSETAARRYRRVDPHRAAIRCRRTLMLCTR